MKILIIGSGVLGYATGIGFAKKGNDLVFYDVDKAKLHELQKQGYATVNSVEDAVDVDVVFICVPTPTGANGMDFSFLQDAAIKAARAIKGNGKYSVVAVRSTVLPTTTRSRVLPLLESNSGMDAGKDFGICMNPEFLRENYAQYDFENPARIVIGELDKRSGDTLANLYEPFKAPTFRVDLDSAEMIKYAANLFLATKISFFNEIFLLCEKAGLSASVVSEIVAMDPRIGTYGVRGGQPFGGKCLPKDLEALIDFAHGKGLNPKMLEAARDLNKEISDYVKGRKPK